MLTARNNDREVRALVMREPVDNCLGVVQCARPSCTAHMALVNDGARLAVEQIEWFLMHHACTGESATQTHDVPESAPSAELTALLATISRASVESRALDASSREHKIELALASGAKLTLLYFSDREQRWIFAYDYVGEHLPGTPPTVVNDVRLTANYVDGLLTSQVVLSMHVVVPARLGQQYFMGVDISPGAKTYLEFIYERAAEHATKRFSLVEICKGARERLRLDRAGLVRPIEFPFPAPIDLVLEHEKYSVPFLTNEGAIAFFELPETTLR
jgi:hypothetical protein